MASLPQTGASPSARLAVCLGLLALLIGALSTESARADIVVPGQKKVKRDSIIDFGAYADGATRSYRVKKGDTLSALAQKHLGSVSRAEEILTLNSGLTADTLRAETTILLPARDSDPKKGWDFFALPWEAHVVRAFHQKPVHHHHYWTSLWAVRRSKTAEFLTRIEAAKGKRRDALKALAKEPWVARAKEKLSGYPTVSSKSPVNSIVENYVVQKIKDGTIILKKTSNKKLDRAGKAISGAVANPSSAWLLALAASGATGLGLLMRRRRVMNANGTESTE